MSHSFSLSRQNDKQTKQILLMDINRNDILFHVCVNDVMFAFQNKTACIKLPHTSRDDKGIIAHDAV